MGNDALGYIKKKEPRQRELLEKLRSIILKHVPPEKERLWSGVPWYDRFYLASFRDHVNMGFSVKGLSSEEMSLFKGNGRFMRHLAFHTIDEVDEERLSRLIKIVLEKGDVC